MKTLRKICLLFAALLILCPLKALAQTAAELDLERLCTLSVTLKGEGNASVSGGTLELYQVADLMLVNGNMTYVPTNGFQNAGISLEDVSAGTSQSAVLAKKLESAIPSAAKKQSASLDGAGKAEFLELQPGLYLIVLREVPAGYTGIDPFLVSLPGSENGQWAYSVDASPKIGTLRPAETTAPINTVSAKPSRLPQTGKTLWPVPVLAVGGVICFLAGLALSRKDKHEKDHR